MNDIGRVTIRTTKPLMIDPYRENRVTGSIILVDDATHETVAAGMIVGYSFFSCLINVTVNFNY